MTPEQRRRALRAKIAANIAAIRTRLLVRPGDEIESVLVAVEALAVTMVDLAADSEDLVRASKRQAAALLTASLTRAMLLRLVLLPAVVGALAAVALLVGEGRYFDNRSDDRLADIENRYVAAYADLSGRYDDLVKHQKAYFDERKAEADRRKAELDAKFGDELDKRAVGAEADIRDFLHVEGARPGFLSWIKRYGIAARALFEANGNSACPQVFYSDGAHTDCVFRKP